MAAHKLPRPPMRGKAKTAETGRGIKPPARPVARERGHKPHLHARLINLDTGTHVDAHGVEHKTSAANPAQVGPMTIVFASKLGHPPMPVRDHFAQGTNVATHLRGRATMPHPNEIAGKIERRMRKPTLPRPPARPLPEGSPAEEAAETPAQEAAEQAMPPQTAARLLPLPPRKAA